MHELAAMQSAAALSCRPCATRAHSVGPVAIRQVQRPEELARKLTELQQRVAQLSSEAAQAGELREGCQTLLSANQRLSRQLAELQKSPGTPFLPVFIAVHVWDQPIYAMLAGAA